MMAYKKADLTFITLYYSIICFIIYKIVDWPCYYKIEFVKQRIELNHTTVYQKSDK